MLNIQANFQFVVWWWWLCGVCVFLNMRRINTDLSFLYSIVDER